MNHSFYAGRAIFATAIAGLGAQCLVCGNPIPALEPVSGSASLPLIGWITGLVLLGAAMAMLYRPAAYYGALATAAVLLLWVALLHLPALAAAPRNGGKWTGALETFALSGAALVLFGLTKIAADFAREPAIAARRASTVGRIIYGVSMPGFGLLHFLYIAYVASVIPGWIPAHVFFAYATGMAHVAAGVGILTRAVSRVAAYCTAAMFGSWVLIVHAPRVIAHAHAPNEWTSMLIALGMCGGALLIASALSNIPVPAARSAGSSSPGTRATVAA